MPQTDRADFALHPSLDPERLRQDYAREGRVQIAPFLAEADAAALQRHLAERADWSLVLNSGAKTFELDGEAQRQLSAEQRAQLEAAVAEAARDGFQFCFENIRVPDRAEERGDSPLDRFARFLSSQPVIETLRHVTGADAITFADAQATRYRPGHLLTAHDDAVPGKNRHAAYVFSLTEGWRAEWGGLLLFHGPDGLIERGYAPRFNALNLFAVPQPHSVSQVTAFAPAPRYAITGWLRSGTPG